MANSDYRSATWEFRRVLAALDGTLVTEDGHAVNPGVSLNGIDGGTVTLDSVIEEGDEGQ